MYTSHEEVYQLNNQRREPIDILEVHESNSLQLFGNSTHLAPWHAKLGYQPHPFVSTLNKLTPDGGTVVLMNIIIEKVGLQSATPLIFLVTLEIGLSRCFPGIQGGKGWFKDLSGPSQ